MNSAYKSLLNECNEDSKRIEEGLSKLENELKAVLAAELAKIELNKTKTPANNKKIKI